MDCPFCDGLNAPAVHCWLLLCQLFSADRSRSPSIASSSMISLEIVIDELESVWRADQILKEGQHELNQVEITKYLPLT